MKYLSTTITFWTPGQLGLGCSYLPGTDLPAQGSTLDLDVSLLPIKMSPRLLLGSCSPISLFFSLLPTTSIEKQQKESFIFMQHYSSAQQRTGHLLQLLLFSSARSHCIIDKDFMALQEGDTVMENRKREIQKYTETRNMDR